MDKEMAGIITGEPMDYEDILRYFGNKLDLSAQEYGRLADKYKTLAFTVSGYSDLQILRAFRAKLVEAIANGSTLRDFAAEMDELLEARGYDRQDPWAADNIFRTNLQTAYNAGAYQEMTAPAVLKARPYWMYDAVDDEATRESHRALSGKVWPADDPVWDHIYPPNGYRCRCSVVTLSQRQLERMGLTVEERPLGIMPDKGFDGNPGKVQFIPDLDGFPASLVEAYGRRNGANEK